MSEAHKNGSNPAPLTSNHIPTTRRRAIRVAGPRAIEILVPETFNCYKPNALCAGTLASYPPTQTLFRQYPLPKPWIQSEPLPKFHSNKAMLPARAMEDVFAEMASGTQATARWISVNTNAMSIDHEPKTEFEKAAAPELSTGKPEFTLVEKGYTRYAGAIPLTDGCVSCHTGSIGKPAQTKRFAGLVISVPLVER